MWTETIEGRKLIQEISKSIVVEVAPEEMDLFDELIMEYFQDPAPPDSSAKSKDNPLGFGLGETLIAVAPAAAAMVSAVLNHLMTESINAAKEESAEAVKKKVKMLFNPEKKEVKEDSKEVPPLNQEQMEQVKKGSREVPPLNQEQMEQVKKLARKQAIQFGIHPDKAEKMANALIGSLALS